MAFPTIVYNASTGSDTAASGAGPATAVTGTSAAHTGGVSSTTITLTNSPDLSGVATDGSAAIWLNTTAGTRHLSKITAVDDGADTVTVEDSFNIASGSAVNYAIGGKRKTLENDTSNVDLQDLRGGWGVDLEAGTYVSAVEASISNWTDADNPVTFTLAATTIWQWDGNIQVIDLAAASQHFQVIGTPGCLIQHTGAAGTAAAFAWLDGDSTTSFHNLTVDCAGAAHFVFINSGGAHSFIDCEIYGTTVAATSAAIYINSGRSHIYINRCSIHDCSGDGIHADMNTSFGSLTVMNSLIYDNAVVGIDLDVMATAQGSSCNIIGNTIYGNTGDGIASIAGSLGAYNTLKLVGNIIASNGGYGVNLPTVVLPSVIENDYNNYHNNTTAARNNLAAGANDIAVDPQFASVTDGSEDFTPSNTALAIVPGGPTA